MITTREMGERDQEVNHFRERRGKTVEKERGGVEDNITYCYKQTGYGREESLCTCSLQENNDKMIDAAAKSSSLRSVHTSAAD